MTSSEYPRDMAGYGRGWKPSRLTRDLFVEKFGAIYEHSRWAAEAAFDRGLPADADTAAGLAKAMAAAVAAGTAEQKRALIAAHPDLAGRLARAKQLTAEFNPGAGERRPRPTNPRRTRALHRAQRRLQGEVRLPVHHGGEGAQQRGHRRRIRATPQQRRSCGDRGGAGGDRPHRGAAAGGGAARGLTQNECAAAASANSCSAAPALATPL